MKKSNKPLFKITDICEMTGLGKSTVFKYIRLGVIPKPMKLGISQANVWNEESIRPWLNQFLGINTCKK